MKQNYDYIIVGAGPAGLAAAVRAAAHGLSVALLDEQHRPGGQIYRDVGSVDRSHAAILGRDYAHGRPLVDRFRKAPVDYLSGTTVWHATPERKIYYIREGKAGYLNAERLLIATGAMERPVPIPGWTLPGVMGAGAVDVLFKSSGMLPLGRIVLAGTGPLLYLMACHLLKCGIRIAALLDTRSVGDYARSVRLIHTALPGYRYLLKGLEMHLRILAGRVLRYSKISDLQALGGDRLEQVSFCSGLVKHEITADMLLLHDGVVPNTQMTRLLDCEHVWESVQRYYRPRLDVWGNSSLPGIAVAGDTGGVYGARSAEICGELAALDTAYQLGAIPARQRDAAAALLRKRLSRERAVRPFLDNLFTPSPHFYLPRREDTMVCRCEEISAGQIRQTARQSGMSPNAVKAKLRCGMGPCQGRLCGLTVSEIIADANQESVASIGYYHIRPPLKPIPLAALAAMEELE